MAHDTQHHLPESDTQPVGPWAWSLFRALAIAGVIGLIVAVLAMFILDRGYERFAFGYVLAYAFVLQFALGGLFFVLATTIFRAGWCITVRRQAETIAASFWPIMPILFIPIAIMVLSNSGVPYPWAQPITNLSSGHHAAADLGQQVILVADEKHGEEAAHGGGHDEHLTQPLLSGKRPYLNIPFFIIRWVLYFVVWSGIGVFYWRKSLEQDDSGDYKLTNQRERWAPVCILLFALTTTFAAIDLLMSLDPVWFSTMWGVYYFAGCALCGVGSLILISMFLQSKGHLQSVNTEHYHDLGKLLFAFTFFWGYIAFSQYMLIWYANIPEETMWLEAHGLTTTPDKMTGWTWIGLVLLVGHLLIPFAGLLSRHVKRRGPLLAFWAVWMIVFCYIDLWWVVMPLFDSHHVTWPGVIEIGCLIGVMGLFFAAVVKRAVGHTLVPTKDPRLGEALAFENL